MAGPSDADNEAPEEIDISRRAIVRGAFRGALAGTAGLSIPGLFDLNAARTMAQTVPNASPPAPLDARPVTFEAVAARAERLAAQVYAPQNNPLPPELAALDYDAFQAIRFRSEATVPLGPRFSMQPFHRGNLHAKRVEIFLQSPEGVRPFGYDPDLFDLGPALQGRRYPASLGYAGFRIAHGFDASQPQAHEEFLVFLGASYFRIRGRGQIYGLSARGIAVNTGLPQGEEFPDFTSFWIEVPQGDVASITIFALLDGPSLTGAYRFAVTPGDPSHVAVEAALFPRRSIAALGLAPLTSMFLFGENGPGVRRAEPFDDFRPQVHDSDGLVVQTPGDRLWRPLVNGRPAPQISSFHAAPLEGFGLLQRERRFAAYLDVQAQHEDRPGLWVTPQGGFGAGAVRLFEIPSRTEATDNIVAAFVPEAPVEAGKTLRLAYSLVTVGAEQAPALAPPLARVVSTRVGSAERLRPTDPPSPQRRLYAIDFEGPGLPDDPKAAIDVALSASAGALVEPYAERVPQTSGWRLYAEFRPPDPWPAGDVVLRARLSHAGRAITETWDGVA
ncbi:glucan biosynthesis protein G [Methylorubrum extorquens]|uniref:Periplasmic glucan biosynthesis protein MdoG n=1 Tax=Methylorubrum extorquens (strain CM4 / NCIMB 13688) TaxID=440085 RepID=B7KS34_METC4|nr:glucan biosynthesis protein G [Methylorubrum extorquens]ACK83919.1 periplasmic glucan biosynthesis protein MdoG [Methylorubrum extorquens CM4]